MSKCQNQDDGISSLSSGFSSLFSSLGDCSSTDSTLLRNNETSCRSFRPISSPHRLSDAAMMVVDGCGGRAVDPHEEFSSSSRLLSGEERARPRNPRSGGKYSSPDMQLSPDRSPVRGRDSGPPASKGKSAPPAADQPPARFGAPLHAQPPSSPAPPLARPRHPAGDGGGVGAWVSAVHNYGGSSPASQAEWTYAEDSHLYQIVERHGSDISWGEIGLQLGTGRAEYELYVRWNRQLQPLIIKWHEEEEARRRERRAGASGVEEGGRGGGFSRRGGGGMEGMELDQLFIDEDGEGVEFV